MNNNLTSQEIESILLVMDNNTEEYWDVIKGKLQKLLQETQMREWNI